MKECGAFGQQAAGSLLYLPAQGPDREPSPRQTLERSSAGSRQPLLAVARAHAVHHLGADALPRDAERLEHAPREPLVIPQQPEQDMLAADSSWLSASASSCAELTTCWPAR